MRSLVLALLVPPALALGQTFTPKAGVPNYDVPIHGHGDYINTPDGKLYYEKEGEGPIVVLVAGGPGGPHTSFHPFFSLLAKDHTVVYFDNIGRGRSDQLKDPKKYTVWRDADDIENLRKALGADKINVIGHSYGGMPAIAYAVRYPQHVSHVVLSDTLHSGAAWQENIDSCNYAAEHQFPEVWEKLTALRKKGVKTGADEYEGPYNDAVGGLYWFDPDKARLMYRSGDKGKPNPVYSSMIGDDPEWKTGGTMRSFDPRPQLKTMNLPVLICVGRYDRVAIPKVAWEMNKMIPNSKLVIFEKSGHRPWVEETEPYFKTVEEFLGDKS